MIDTFFDWFPLIALVLLVTLFLRPIHVVRYLMNRALRQGRPHEAMGIVTRYTRIRPRDPYGWFSWVWLLEREGSSLGITGVLRQGVEHNPRSVELSVALADALMRAEEHHEAFELLNELRDRHPEAPEPVTGLAELAVRAGNKEEAKRLISQASALIQPKKHSDAAVDIASLLLFLKDPEGAEDILSRVEPHTGEASVHILLALLRERTDPQQARRNLAAARYYWKPSRDELAEAFEGARSLVE